METTLLIYINSSDFLSLLIDESDFTSNEAPEKLSMEHFSGINKKLYVSF